MTLGIQPVRVLLAEAEHVHVFFDPDVEAFLFVEGIQFAPLFEVRQLLLAFSSYFRIRRFQQLLEQIVLVNETSVRSEVRADDLRRMVDVLDAEARIIPPIDVPSGHSCREVVADLRKRHARNLDGAEEGLHTDQTRIFRIVAFFQKDEGDQALLQVQDPALIDQPLACCRLDVYQIRRVITLHALVGLEYVGFAFFRDLDIFTVQKVH